MIEAVLFDFYDSLVRIRTDDWGDEAMRGVAYFLRYHGILMHRADAREAAQEALQRQVSAASDPNFEVDLGLMWRTVIEERASDYPARYDDAYLARLGRTLARIQRSQSRDEFELRDGVLDILHDLRKDYRLGILSNGQGDFVRPELAELEIDHLFEAVVVSSDHGYRKPDPRLFQHGTGGVWPVGKFRRARWVDQSQRRTKRRACGYASSRVWRPDVGDTLERGCGALRARYRRCSAGDAGNRERNRRIDPCRPR